MKSSQQYPRKKTYSVMIPKRIPKTSDNDLRISLVTLKNSIAAMTVYTSKIEKELLKREVPSSIILATRKPIPNSDIVDHPDSTESAIV